MKQHFDRIVSLHLKDRGNDPEHLDHSFGEGSTPLKEVLTLCKHRHFKYVANIEWEVKDADPAKGVSDALAFCRNVLV
jgi:sugar phosphate isomerase/epimerase